MVLVSNSSENKKVVWLPDVNKYIVVSHPVDLIIEHLYQGKSYRLIFEYCINKLGLLPDEADQTIRIVKNKLKELHKNENVQKKETPLHLKIHPTSFNCKRYYQINDLVFFIEFETAQIEYLIHPKFAHLEVPQASEFMNHFQLFFIGSKIVLIVNGKQIGSWFSEMQHFMKGKVSMEILQKIYNKNEDEWMAVFHAAGISNGKEGILFIGDSGDGKSTISAILMASGFEVLADDFLPVESATSQLCSFPAAISVKHSAFGLLVKQFPGLEDSWEYSYPAFNKTVRYLSSPDSAQGKLKKIPCKALVFVKYKANTGLQFSSLSKEIALQKLIPGSWISPLESNAKCFLDWFDSMPCYQLTYSDNEAMIETVKNIFENAI